MIGSHAVAKALEGERVKFVFGIPGGHSVEALYDGLYDVPEIQTILVRQEQSAAFMAHAYARLTAQPCVCTGTVGPGAENLVTGIAEAYGACMPVIAIAPQVSTADEFRGAGQETPMVPLFTPITKWSARVNRTDRIPWFIRRAFQIACTGKPGPVFIEIPVDVGATDADIPEYVPSKRPIRVRPDLEDLRRASELILKAERPVIVAGGGIYLSRAFDELLRFAEMLAMPVLTSSCGKGSIPEDHPLSAGVIGMYFDKVSKKVWEEADLLIGIGTRFKEYETGAWSFFPENAKLIQIDIDPTEIGRNWMPDAAVVGDAKLVMQDLTEIMSSKAKKCNLEDMPRIKEITKVKEEYQMELSAALQPMKEPIRPLLILRELRSVFPRGTIFVHENGSLDVWSYPSSYLPVLETGLDVMECVGNGSMGFGVSAVIGAKFAKPDKFAVCIAGDGAFQMGMRELSTAAQYKAAPTWIVFNNHSLGWIKYWQKVAHKGRVMSVDFEVQADFSRIAEANKCFGQRVTETREVKHAVQDALKANEENIPAVLDFEVSPMDFYDGFREFHEEVWFKGVGGAA